MKFRVAVEEAPGLEDAYKKGLQALKEVDQNRIHCSKPRSLTGSIYLDTALTANYPNDQRWDYGIGYKKNTADDEAIWVEVHPASSHNITEMLNKLSWLREWLSSEAEALNEITTRFIWISSGRVALTAGSPQRKKIAAAGLEFAGVTFRLS